MASAALTLQEAADLLGVHYMTAYRYVRLGLLEAHKAGGTWRVEPAALDEFRRGTVATVSPIGSGRRKRAPWAERLEQRLLAGDARGSWGVIEAALAAGAELDEVYLDVLAPALASIGSRWERGEIDISLEHRASGIATRLVGRLGPRFVRRGRSRGVVLVGSPSGERHALPVAMLADLVRHAGWEVFDLGADTPAASFAHAARTTPDLVAVGVSVMTSANLDAAAETLAALREVVEPSVLLVVGGGGVRDEVQARQIGADAFAADAAALVALLDDLATASPPTVGDPAAEELDEVDGVGRVVGG